MHGKKKNMQRTVTHRCKPFGREQSRDLSFTNLRPKSSTKLGSGWYHKPPRVPILLKTLYKIKVFLQISKRGCYAANFSLNQKASTESHSASWVGSSWSHSFSSTKWWTRNLLNYKALLHPQDFIPKMVCMSRWRLQFCRGKKRWYIKFKTFLNKSKR